jgi:hypothetical protein
MEGHYLPGIYRIEFLKASNLTIYPRQKVNPGSKISAIGEYTKLPLIGSASLKYENEETKAGTVYNTVISGALFDREDVSQSLRDQLANGEFVYRTTDMALKKYLIGINEAPFPIVKFSPRIDSLPTGSRLIDFTITWRSTLPPLEIVAL